MLRTKSCRYIDCIVEVMQGNPHRFVNMAAPLPRLIKGCLESGLAKKWLSLFKALMEDGQRQQLDDVSAHFSDATTLQSPSCGPK